MNRLKIMAGLTWLMVTLSCSVEKKFVQTELYFGLSQNNGTIIPDSTWNNFVRNDVAKVFPEGFSELNINGKWYDVERKELTSEPSRMISVVYKDNQILSSRIDSLRNRYKDLFRQQSVLRVDKKAGISF